MGARDANENRLALDAPHALGGVDSIDGSMREPLSAAGLARREAILGIALRAQSARRTSRARRARTTAALALVAIGLAATAVALTLHRGVPASSTMAAVAPMVHGAETTPSPARTSEVASAVSRLAIVRIVEDPSALDRARIVGSGRAQFVDDDALLEFLRQAGRPSGIVRVNGRATLAANAVADARTSG